MATFGKIWPWAMVILWGFFLNNFFFFFIHSFYLFIYLFIFLFVLFLFIYFLSFCFVLFLVFFLIGSNGPPYRCVCVNVRCWNQFGSSKWITLFSSQYFVILGLGLSKGYPCYTLTCALNYHVHEQPSFLTMLVLTCIYMIKEIKFFRNSKCEFTFWINICEELTE